MVEHDVDLLVGRDLPFDRIKELDQVLVPMALPVLADDRAVEHVGRVNPTNETG